ncbi:MAG: glycerophosphodiester phosphodiesterase family protein [Pseudomonadota bacterium]
MHKRTLAMILGGIALAALTGLNASVFAPTPPGTARVIAHRGVYHYFDRTGVGRDDCTASRIVAPVHHYFENTVRSMREALALGADAVEVDIAPTRDGEIVLFHDWTVDCRTEGSGETRDLTLRELQALDVGYGYTADGGETYPLRGRGVGQMPTLQEALDALPASAIMFNFKSDDPAEADQLADALLTAGRDPVPLGDLFYGATAPSQRIADRFPGVVAFGSSEAKVCTKDYLLTGWSGRIPPSCRDKVIGVPLNLRHLFWGWPNRFIARMADSNTRILVFGPYARGTANLGLIRPAQLDAVPNAGQIDVLIDDMWAMRGHLVRWKGRAAER